MADLDTNETSEVTIADTAGVNRLSVSAAGAASINQTHVGGTAITLGQKAMASSYPVVLPSNQTVQVSVSQSTDLDNGKVFYAAVTGYNLASAGNDNPIFLFKNPSGSGKTMYIFSINGNCQVTNVAVGFNLYKSPIITANGTAFTPVNANIGNSTTSVLNVYTGSTISNFGTLVIADQVGQNSNSSNMVITQLIAVQANQNVVITGSPFSNNRSVIMTIGWIEK